MGFSAGTAAALGAVYGLVARPRHLTWGSTHDELTRAMPFDEVVRGPNFVATRAITIAAPPAQVWPFLIDTARLPRGTGIAHTDEPSLVLFIPNEPHAEATWVVTLEPCAEGTRLVSRNRARFRGGLPAIARYLAVDPGQFLFERQWLLDVRTRSENQVQVAELVPQVP